MTNAVKSRAGSLANGKAPAEPAVSPSKSAAPSDAATAGDDIDKLNAEVARLMQSFASPTYTGTNPMKNNPEAVAAVQAGAIVYHRRSVLFLLTLVGVVAWTFVTAPTVAYAAACVAVMFVWVDLYGAVLHVVLDHPAFIKYPIISDGCLEFQWHHAIPCVPRRARAGDEVGAPRPPPHPRPLSSLPAHPAAVGATSSPSPSTRCAAT